MQIRLFFRGLLISSALSCFVSPALSEGLAGSYLAANHANATNDYVAAADYYAKALSQDPNDGIMLQNALLAHVATGDMSKAIELSDEIRKQNFDSQLSDIVTLSAYIQNEDFAKAKDHLEKSKNRISPLVSKLLEGWILVGSGNMSGAIDHFDNMRKPEGLFIFGQYHKALSVALAGNFELAAQIMQGDGKEAIHLNRGGIIAHVQILSQLDRFDEAIDILQKNISGQADQQLRDLLEKMQAKQVVPFDFIRSAKDGVSETFSTFSIILDGENEERRLSLVYARLAEYTRPDNIQALLAVSDDLNAQEQYDLATQALAKVPSDHPLFLNAEIGRANTLVYADKPEAAVAVLQKLMASHPSVARVHIILGDIYTDEKQYREASKAYTSAINLLEKAKNAGWFVYYARGIAYERLDEWEKAEADFRKSLEISPDQPATLNYLGYSLVEKRIKMDEAQDMIERAVKRRPDDGFITDSLGWVLYRLGKFEEAVAPMERAAELLPTDPVVNDHLGDVYWKVGRKREARFQWRRALSFDPEEKEAVRIRLKLDIGLDEVLLTEDTTQSNAN